MASAFFDTACGDLSVDGVDDRPGDREMTSNLSTTSMALLAAGGIAYTLGGIFYAVRTIPYNHAIWHLFVIAGSVCHYFAVYTAVLPSNSFASH
ncbi:hemolysin III family protein [Vreelandella stevensii]|uniref:hemolysin III family protein n=1 Tax=Vreelandella stevensii TaxID=502821 RepID=UPI00403B2BAC